MALTIKQLNGDASFLLTFERIDSESPDGGQSAEPFRILLDPRLAQSTPSSSTRARQESVSPKDVPEPDVIIISNSRSDHCNEAALRQFAPGGAKPRILAEPTAAKVIQSWRHFEQGKVATLHRWQDPRQTGRSTVVRIPIAARVIGGEEGLVTVAFVTQKRERKKGLRSAVAITYRPASSSARTTTMPPRPVSTILTAAAAAPLSSNKRDGSGSGSRSAQLLTLESHTLPPLPAFMPLTPPATPVARRPIRATRSMASLSPHAKDRGVSVIFSPHGIPYRDIEPYATSHLLAEAALPLTVLLHSFDTVSRPWWLGGTLTSGFEDGQEIIAKLGARVWISACDAERNTSGLIRRFTRRRRYTRDQVRQLVHGAMDTHHHHETRSEGPGPGSGRGSGRSRRAERPTEVLALGIDEHVTLTSEGIWAAETASPKKSDDTKRLSIRHVPADAAGPSAAKATYGLSQLGPAAVAVA
ncbi:hypothetical protein C2857_004152 [Epichloe festucae Fl1]|uniref:Uncharacterized protein n=1 Tax=Epichloe festucae (strain Fl1) TaxID=877507 RepID=A0A7S9KS87_EPIFF|nr:hypothetical protein C2857_004152 [Epichloe festucae Fl1]